MEAVRQLSLGGVLIKRFKAFISRYRMNEYAEASMVKSNLEISFILAVLVLAEIILMITGIINNKSKVFNRPLIERMIESKDYIYIYWATISVWMIIHSFLYDAGKLKNVKLVRFMVLFFVISNVAASTYMAIIEYQIDQHVFAFLMGMILSICGVVLIPIHSLVFTSAAFAWFIHICQETAGMSRITIYKLVFTGFLIVAVSFLRYFDKLSGLKAYEKLQNITFLDSLTGCRNRYAFRGDFDQYVGANVILMMLDIDRFKSINDTYGHETGDDVLKDFAKTLQRYYGMDNVYRFGGDEFMVVVKDMEEAAFKATGEEMRQAFKDTVKDRLDAKTSCSGGYIVTKTQKSADLREALHQADEMLYEAKNHGRDAIVGRRI